MKAFLAAVVAVVVISVGANVALTGLDYTAASKYSTDSVRLDP